MTRIRFLIFSKVDGKVFMHAYGYVVVIVRTKNLGKRFDLPGDGWSLPRLPIIAKGNAGVPGSIF